MHGIANWEAGTYLSESIEQFTWEIRKVNNFIRVKSSDETNPKITYKDLDKLISEIIKEDKYGDIHYWKFMLEPIYKSTQEYENSLMKKVQTMFEAGMNLKEISEVLNMSLSDIYGYLKSTNK